LDQAGIVDGAAFTHLDKDSNARIVRPGDPAHSYLYLRMCSTEHRLQMPPLGRSIPDQKAIDLVEAWIRSMPMSEDEDSTAKKPDHAEVPR
jgi:hypothetical protein